MRKQKAEQKRRESLEDQERAKYQMFKDNDRKSLPYVGPSEDERLIN